ncbi:high mobility group nucleosome-binding domain-containing protein 5-like isoform X2 [Dermacentor albipictus]|uniref:high mobility group nucleosome-binding domain-containing protein 5-like isoform X2 n=1 Tax=Dermacentor albipictus TaxID=60249 RepID=UPI0031FCC844
MADERENSDDSHREQRKRPAEDGTSGQSEAKVPRLLSKDEKGEDNLGTPPEQERAGAATKRSNDTDSGDKQAGKADALDGERDPKVRRVAGEGEEDKDAKNSEAAKEGDETDSEDTDRKDTENKNTDEKNDSKDTDRKDTESKDADSNGEQSTDDTDGESEPKKRKVADENEVDQGEDADSAEKAAKTERGEEEDAEKQEGGEEENNGAAGKESEEGDDEDDYNPFRNVVLVMEKDENGEWRLADVLIDGDEEEEETEEDEAEDDTEDDTEEDELVAAFAALFDDEQEAKAQADQTASQEDGRQSLREGAEGENKKEGGLKTKDETREDENNEAAEERVNSGRDVEEHANVEEDDGEDPVTLHVIFNKQSYDIKLPLTAKMSRLKVAVMEKTGIEPSMQKLCFKGASQADDNKSLRHSGLSENSKILLVGSTVRDLDAVLPPKPQKSSQTSPLLKREPFCKQARHKAIIDDGVPDDAYPGIANVHDNLPDGPITGMLNSQKQKVRLTLRLAEDQFWISTKETTEKYSMSKALAVVSQPIEGHEEYHIMDSLPYSAWDRDKDREVPVFPLRLLSLGSMFLAEGDASELKSVIPAAYQNVTFSQR